MYASHTDEIDRGKSIQLHCRVGLPYCRETPPQMHVIPSMQEIRIGQDGEVPISDDHSGSANEENGALAKTFLERNAGFCGGKQQVLSCCGLWLIPLGVLVV